MAAYTSQPSSDTVLLAIRKKDLFMCFCYPHLSLSGVSWGEEGAASRSFSYLMSRGAMFDFAKGS